MSLKTSRLQAVYKHTVMISTSVYTSLSVLVYSLLICYHRVTSQPADTFKRHDVVIIGAGVAGISAGQELLKNNVSDILVLEGRNRIGGRIHTLKFGGQTIDLGAQYVYAFDGNSVFDLTKDLGLYYKAPERHSSLISWGGYHLNKSLLNEMMKLKFDLKHHDNASYSQHWLPKLSEYMIQKDISYQDGTLYLDAGRKLFSIHNGADVDDISAWGYTKYRESSYGRSKMWIDGFQTLLKILMGEEGDKTPNLGLSEKILMNKEVVGIDYDDTGVTITCADNSVYHAEKVIVTLPLGVLKNLPISFFNPPLPEEKLKVIKNLGFGFVDKLFIKFEEELTADDNVIFAMHSGMKDQFSSTKKVGMWPARLTGICPTRDSSTLLNSWLVGHDTVIMEQLSLDQVMDGVVAIVNTLLGRDIPQPKALLRSKWATDRFAFGSYSYRSVDTETYNVSHGQLSQPLLNSQNQPVVLFAGEATSEYHYGTVHGALETGWDAARSILDSLNS